MNNSQKIKKMAGLSLLAALVVVLQLVSTYLPIGTVSITLALIPIVVGAIVYGPGSGFVLGIVMGIFVCLDPKTIGFLQYSFIGTVIVCLLKSAIAGFISGIIFKLLCKKNMVLAIILAAISVPIINTGLFLLASLTIFLPLIVPEASDAGVSAIVYIVVYMIGINFVIEFIVNSILSPVVIRIVELYGIHKKIGSNTDLSF